MKLMKRLPLAIAVMLAVGCTHSVEYKYIREPLPLPERPLLQQVYDNELQCLSDDVYERLLLREVNRRYYAEELEAIIRSTHKDSASDK